MKRLTQNKVDRARDALEAVLDCDDVRDQLHFGDIEKLRSARDILTMVVR